MFDYYKETMKQYYQKFNLPEPSIAIKVIDNYDFGARRRIENFKFSSLDKKFRLCPPKVLLKSSFH